MKQSDNSADRETIMAEFTALRAEIVNRSNIQWNVFALQLTASGVVFSFALSNSSHIAILLIIPWITYALTGRYVSQGTGVHELGKYIREVLEVKMNGELHWETWRTIQPVQARALSWLNPLYLVFPGVAVIALASVAPYVWTSSNTSSSKRALIIVIWLIGVLVTALAFQLVARRVSIHKGQILRRRPNDNLRPALRDSDPGE